MAVRRPLISVMRLASRALARAVPNCRSNRVANTPIIAITTNSSTKVTHGDKRSAFAGRKLRLENIFIETTNASADQPIDKFHLAKWRLLVNYYYSLYCCKEINTTYISTPSPVTAP